MQIVNDLTGDHLAYWADQFHAAPITMKAPAGMTDCADCAAIVTREDDGLEPIRLAWAVVSSEAGNPPVIRVAWKPDEIDLAHLARGGTIWLSTWGGLPPHSLEVQAP